MKHPLIFLFSWLNAFALGAAIDQSNWPIILLNIVALSIWGITYYFVTRNEKKPL